MVKKCVVLFCNGIFKHCPVCEEAVKKQQYKDKRFEANIKILVKPNALLSNTHPEKVKIALINERMKFLLLQKVDERRLRSNYLEFF